MIYAGAGSRKAPREVLHVLKLFARATMERGAWWRVGHAPGSDQAIEAGARLHCTVFLPWPSFEAQVPIKAMVVHDRPMPMAYELSYGAQMIRGGTSARASLYARNYHVMMGKDLMTPADALVCWTPDGEEVGGTGHVLRLARYHQIPVRNLGLSDQLARAIDWLQKVRAWYPLPAPGDPSGEAPQEAPEGT